MMGQKRSLPALAMLLLISVLGLAALVAASSFMVTLMAFFWGWTVAVGVFCGLVALGLAVAFAIRCFGHGM